MVRKEVQRLLRRFLILAVLMTGLTLAASGVVENNAGAAICCDQCFLRSTTIVSMVAAVTQPASKDATTHLSPVTDSVIPTVNWFSLRPFAYLGVLCGKSPLTQRRDPQRSQRSQRPQMNTFIRELSCSPI